jgi:hypothetical protein
MLFKSTTSVLSLLGKKRTDLLNAIDPVKRVEESRLQLLQLPVCHLFVHRLCSCFQKLLTVHAVLLKKLSPILSGETQLSGQSPEHPDLPGIVIGLHLKLFVSFRQFHCLGIQHCLLRESVQVVRLIRLRVESARN